MGKESLDSCGLLFLYLAGQLGEDGRLYVRKTDSCQYLMDFSEQVRSLQAETAGGTDIELFCTWAAAKAWTGLRQPWGSRFRIILREF